MKQIHVCKTFLLITVLLVSSLHAAEPGASRTSGSDAKRYIGDVRKELSDANGCAKPFADLLHKVLCTKTINIGVREHYPSFGTRSGEERLGYDVDVGRLIAQSLGVRASFQRVNATTRIAYANEGRIDLIIATMGHNTRREEHIRFIRPHYYQSETVIVGSKAVPAKTFADLQGQSVCVTIGNGSNVNMASQGLQIRLMKSGPEMIRALEGGRCLFAAQDSSYFDAFLARPAFAQRFERKFGFAPVPWGIGVTKEKSDQFADVLNWLSEEFHRSGAFVKIAEKHKVDASFLKAEQAKWNLESCRRGEGQSKPDGSVKACYNSPSAVRACAFRAVNSENIRGCVRSQSDPADADGRECVAHISWWGDQFPAACSWHACRHRTVRLRLQCIAGDEIAGGEPCSLFSGFVFSIMPDCSAVGDCVDDLVCGV